MRAAAEAWDQGAEGERATADALSLLPPDFSVFHDLLVPGSRKANLDHLVIGPTGVWLIDSKAYSTPLHYRNGTLWRGRYPMRKESQGLEWMAETVSRQLDADVTPVLCFTHSAPSMPCPPLGRVQVATPGTLQVLLLQSPVVLSPPMVEWLVREAQEMANPLPAPPPRPSEVVGTSIDRAARHVVEEPLPSTRDGRTSKSLLHGLDRTARAFGALLRAALAMLILLILFGLLVGLASSAKKKADRSAVPVPNVVARARCDIPGGGYRIVLAWPGSLDGLAGYRVRLENGFAGEMGFWTSPYTPNELKPLYRLPPGIAVELSMVTEMEDGRRSEPGRTTVNLPSEPC